MLKSSILTSFVRKPKVFNSVAIPAPSIRPQTRPAVFLSVPPAARAIETGGALLKIKLTL